MSDEGPLEIRSDTRGAFLGVVPNQAELLVTTDDANEGAIWTGAKDGGPAGGIQAGLRPQDRGRLTVGAMMPHQPEMAVKVLASVRNWQVDPAYPGFQIPPSNQTVLHHKICAGFVPARVLNDGGFIELHATGWYRRGGSANPTLTAKVLFNGAYFGPLWAGNLEQGWGWWAQDPQDNAFENDVNWNWTFKLRITSLGYAGAKDADDNTVTWRLEGEFEIWAGNYVQQAEEDDARNAGNDNDVDKTLFRRKRRLIREHMATVDPARDLEVLLTMGNPRPAGGGTTLVGDSMHVHGADMLLYCPYRGREFGPGHLGAPLGVN